MNGFFKFSPWLLAFVFFSFSCKKDSSRPKLGSLDLSGGYALVVPEYPENSVVLPNQVPDFAKLYKIASADTLQTVKYLSTDGLDMGFSYIPEAVYDLNSDYLFITLSRKAETPKVYESYLIKKDGGNAKEINPEFHPNALVNNAMTDDFSSKTFREGPSNIFYCFTNQNIESLNLTQTNLCTFLSQSIPEVSNSDFLADFNGNILIDGKIITSTGSQDIALFSKGKSFISKAPDNGFYMATLGESSIEINNIYLENNVLTTKFIKSLDKGSDPWVFRGSAAFPAYNCSVFVFDKGILYISPSDTKILPLSLYGLNEIELMDHSSKNFYISGTNVLNKKIFMLMNPSSNPITYTHTFAPNTYHIKKLQVTSDNLVTFFASRISDNRDVIGYLPESSNVMIKINHQGIIVKQFVAYK